MQKINFNGGPGHSFIKSAFNFIERALGIKKIGEINLDFLTLDYICFHYDFSGLDKNKYTESEFITAVFFSYLAKQIYNLGDGRVKNFLIERVNEWATLCALVNLLSIDELNGEIYKEKIQQYDRIWLEGLVDTLRVGDPFLKRMKIFRIDYQLEPIGIHSSSVSPKYYKIEIMEGKNGKYINTWFSIGFGKYLVPTSCYGYFKIVLENYDKQLLLKGLEIFSSQAEQLSNRTLLQKFKDPELTLKIIKTAII